MRWFGGTAGGEGGGEGPDRYSRGDSIHYDNGDGMADMAALLAL